MFLVPLSLNFSFFFTLSFLFLFLLPFLGTSLNTPLSPSTTKLIPSYLNSFKPLLFIFIIFLFSIMGEVLVFFQNHFFISPFAQKIHFTLLIMIYVPFVFFYYNFSSSTAKVATDTLFLIFLLNFSIPLLFYSATLLSFILVLEFLTLIFFVLIAPSSILSLTLLPFTNFNYKIYPPFESLFFFFWTSFFVSLGLFYSYLHLSCSPLFINFHSWNLFLMESSSLKEMSYVATFFLCLFLKGGLTPFFFWKPVFFNSMPLPLLFLYIVYFYFYFSIWFFSILFFLPPSIFLYTTPLFFCLLIVSVFFLFPLLFFTTRIKYFLALSSILNAFILFMTLFLY
uniref:NADH dehydrogenase subunit 2-a n=1 Tax=Bakuella subtropica TaxID=1295181 RepID=UPI0023F359B9|nr:NADH dehydrogenase subunit 2-a [Bakuella subtropica]WDY80886.1 NADH dehydrogenase subunit 2-a [Bakuella subtropica]